MKKNENMKQKLTITFLLLIISLSFFMLIFFKIETDYFWHIKAGEYMFHYGILTHDVFSWFVHGKYWMSHEWLFEIFLFGLQSLFGNLHVLVYSFLCLISLLFILFFPNKNNFCKNIPYTLFYLLFFFLIFLGFIQARPHLISFLLLAITIYFLYDLYKNKDSKKIYFLPFISILWSNVHGGSSNLPYLLCFLFLFGGIFSFRFQKIEATRLHKKQFLKYFIVMILCMISVCINIHGFKMFLYPYENMLDITMIYNISEWRSTSLNDLYHYTYYSFLLFLIFTMLFSDKKIQWMDLLLLGFVCYLGLKSIRFWPYTYIVMSFVIFSYVKERKMDEGTYSCLAVLTIFLFGFFLYSFKGIYPVSYMLSLNDEIISIIKKEKPERLFNMYNLGGELIYHEIPVFIDGRADLYGKYNYKDYLDISNLNGDYVSIIEQYDFDYFLVSRDYPISTYLKYNDHYELIYHKKDLLLYKKS